MLNRWHQWNRQAKLWLSIVTLIGVIAALPLGVQRMTMEKSAQSVEYVFDYRDIVEASDLQPRPRQFVEDRLTMLKEAGVTSMAVYESSLKELMQAGRLTYYNEKEAALLQGKLADERSHNTYILFSGQREAEQIGPVVRDAFDRMGVSHREWFFDGREGLIVEESTAAAGLKTMDFDPISLAAIHEAGFHIVARFSDRVVPYDAERTEEQLARLHEYGVTRLLFDGEKVKGFSDQTASKSLDHFASLLDKYEIGLTTIENLKRPQQGLNQLAYLTNYNIARLYSLSPEDSIEMTQEGVVDRFLLAAKDRNIRMFFLNAMTLGNADTGTLDQSVDKLAEMMIGERGVVQTLADNGFPAGSAQPFHYEKPSWEKPVRGVAALGAVAIIALLIGAYLPALLIPVFGIGLVGSAGLYVLNSSLMEQALALGAAVSAPTLGLIWVMNRIYARTIGERRMVGGEDWTISGSGEEPRGTKWIFPDMPIGKRIGLALNWFLVATCISLCAVPLVFGLLNNITYSLVLEQFRGVSVLHLAPIVLIAVYVFLYEGSSTKGVLKRATAHLSRPITVMWVLLIAVLGAVGFYYLSRTGNAGQVSQIELLIRGWLESTFGVRPRFKEFVLGHPPLLLGLFLALRYRVGWLLIIVGALGQLTMVGTFTHIHSPLAMSIARTLLGLGGGLLIGFILIAVWIVLEGAWRRWAWPMIQKYSAS